MKTREDVFEQIYLAKLNRDLNSPSEEPIGMLAELKLEAEDQNELLIERSTRMPEQVWQELSALQRARSTLKEWIKQLKSNDPEISREDYLRFVLDKGISDEAARVVFELLDRTYYNQNNPSVTALAENVVAQVTSGNPLRFSMSQCISKGPTIRPGKLDYFLFGKQDRKDPATFCDGLESKGWEKLRQIAREVGYPIEIEIIVADMDFLTIDGGMKWCTPESLERLKAELLVLKEAVAQKAARFFKAVPAEVTVRSWSEFYSYSDYEAALVAASDPSNWPDRTVIEASRSLYEYYYGNYRGKIDDADLDRFIFEDVTRTAAQYRLEADITIKRGRIQAWAEQVPSPIWPIDVSNYNRAGYAPSLLLLTN